MYQTKHCVKVSPSSYTYSPWCDSLRKLLREQPSVCPKLCPGTTPYTNTHSGESLRKSKCRRKPLCPTRCPSSSPSRTSRSDNPCRRCPCRSASCRPSYRDPCERSSVHTRSSGSPCRSLIPCPLDCACQVSCPCPCPRPFTVNSTSPGSAIHVLTRNVSTSPFSGSHASVSNRVPSLRRLSVSLEDKDTQTVQPDSSSCQTETAAMFEATSQTNPPPRTSQISAQTELPDKNTEEKTAQTFTPTFEEKEIATQLSLPPSRTSLSRHSSTIPEPPNKQPPEDKDFTFGSVPSDGTTRRPCCIRPCPPCGLCRPTCCTQRRSAPYVTFSARRCGVSTCCCREACTSSRMRTVFCCEPTSCHTRDHPLASRPGTWLNMGRCRTQADAVEKLKNKDLDPQEEKPSEDPEDKPGALDIKVSTEQVTAKVKEEVN